MERKRFLQLFIIVTTLVAAAFLLSMMVVSKYHPRNSTPPTPEALRAPTTLFVNSNESSYITACSWAGPFEEPPAIEQLSEAVVGKPATTSTVWRDYIGKGDTINLADDFVPDAAKYYVFEMWIGVYSERAGTYKIQIRGTGEMYVYVDGTFLKKVSEPDASSYFNDFTAPGDFSESPRRITLAIKPRFGNVGCQASLRVGSEREHSISMMRWITGNSPTYEGIAARAIFMFPLNGGVIGDDSFCGAYIKLDGGLPMSFTLTPCTVEISVGNSQPTLKVLHPEDLREGAIVRTRFEPSTLPKSDLRIKLSFESKPAGNFTFPLFVISNYTNCLPGLQQRIDALSTAKGRDADLCLMVEQMKVSADTLNRMVIAGSSEYYLEDSAKKLDKLYTKLSDALSKREVGDDPFFGITGEVERAYISEVDGFPQPYKVYLPPDYYTVQRVRPVVIFLHGYVTSYTLAEWGEGVEEFIANWYKLGAIIFQPFGRSNTDFQTCGETDVMDVYRIALEKYKGDPRRVYLIGVSMGGMGVWTIAERYPDKFAAIIPMAGRTDYYYWYETKPEDHPFYYNFQVKLWNPIDHIPCFRNQNILIFHGEDDYTVQTRHSEKMSERLTQSSIKHELSLIPGDHMSVFSKLEDFELAKKVEQMVRDPGEIISFRSLLPKYASRAWLSVPLFEKWGDPVEVYGEIKGRKIDIKAENALRLEIRPWPGILFAGTKVSVRVNEVEMGEFEIPESGVEIELSKLPAHEYEKTPLLCGPGLQITSEPFALVYGDENDKLHAEQFGLWWWSFAKGRARMLSAGDAELVQGQFHFILFGTPASNPYLAKIADRLPIKFGDGKYIMPDGSGYSAENGLVFVHPNPNAPRTLVMVCSGPAWGESLAINHRYDFLPDYAIFTPNLAEKDKMDTLLVAGYFDTFWKFEPSLMEVFEANGKEDFEQ